MTIQILPCKAQQLAKLREISIVTYRDTFADSNSEALMQQYFDDALNTEKLLQEFNVVGSSFYFIYSDDAIAGYLKINVDDAKTDDVASNSLEVERFYISKQYKRLGLGKQLMAFVYQLAREANKSSIWLGVWEGNLPALAFYQAQGFYQVGTHPFNMGGDIQTDLLLKKDL
jgi:ribosomal protein S18 acetylase RimI-like enzyme